MQKLPSITALLLCLLLVCGCSKQPTSTPGEVSSSPLTEIVTGTDSDDLTEALQVEFIAEDGYLPTDSAAQPSETAITLSGTKATATGDGVGISGTTITVSKPGIYRLSGTLENGKILVNCALEGTVRLILNDAQVTCSNGPALYVAQADKTVLVLADGTQNSLADGAGYTATGEEDPDAAIFSHDDLTITGNSGTLTVTGNYNDGLKCKDTLKLNGGNLTVKSVDDGIVGRDCVGILGGQITVQAEGDGIKSTHDTDTQKGYISVGGGTLNITAGADGLQAVTSLLLQGGTYNIQTGGGSANSSTVNNGGIGGPWGQWGGTQTEDTSSAKGLKAGGYIEITDGAYTLDTSDDAIHSNGNIKISGGNFTLTSGDDGVHADTDLTIENATLTVEKSYEAIEGLNITVNSGTLRLTSSDDGINAAGGNGALDYDSKFTVNGGVLLAAGSSQMAMAHSADSTQYGALLTFSGQNAGTLLSLRDTNGNTLAAFAPARSFSSLLVCLPTLQQGQTYTLYVGGALTGEQTDGYSAGNVSGGTQLTQFTANSVVTSTGGSMGGPGGGMGGRPGKFW